MIRHKEKTKAATPVRLPSGPVHIAAERASERARSMAEHPTARPEADKKAG